MKLPLSTPLIRRFIFTSLFFIAPIFSYAQENFIKYTDPLIGTGGHGHCYPGATVPFGMVQLSPDNGTQGWDWCSGYNYADSMIAGFSHMHLSGTGVGEWCDISVMPCLGLVPDTCKLYQTKFKHENEVAQPGYYSVLLDNGIQASFTATEHCGFHKYYFPNNAKPVIRFNLGFSINYDSTTETFVKKINDSTIVGYRFSTGWAKVQKVYFAAITSVPIQILYLNDGSEYTMENMLKGHYVNCNMVFKDLSGRPLLMKVALSTVGTDQAQQALNEIEGWGFDSYRKKASKKWEKEMDKIQVKTSNNQLKRLFYSALYHTCLAPVLYSDNDGVYKNANDSVKKMKNGQRYTVFSLWDTFRGLNPLFTITQPERNTDILNSMMAFYDENGELPVWDLSTWETGCMSGYHAIPVLADAILKNTKGINPTKVYAAMRKSAFQDIRGTKDYIKYGYLPQDKGGYSVTITLEYAFDDWCIAQVAKKLGLKEDYALFMKRAAAYKLLFDKSSGFIRAKNAEGAFVEPFNPYFSSTDERQAMYEEGNAWQYTFFVPHDIRGLANEFGGQEKFIEKLDSLFIASTEVKGETSPPDMSGLIGQYIHGNEPSHHIAYMYDFVGQPWKTQEKIRYIIDSMYHDTPQNGYAGNEDCGQMSAWLVWGMLGFYPANPASGEYAFGSPIFDEAKIQLPDDKTLKIIAKNNSKKNMYIQGIKLNGTPYTKTYINHETIMKGGILEFEMGPNPNKNWGVDSKDFPYSMSN